MHASRVLFLRLTVVVCLVSLPALAQERTPLPYAPYAVAPVRLDLTGDEPMAITVYYAEKGADREKPLFVCTQPCSAWVYPAKYRFRVRGGPEKITGDRVVEVERSQQLSFSLPDQSEKNGALAMAVTGTALIPVGFLVTLVAAISASCSECSPDDSRKETPVGVYVGFGMLVTGAVLTPLGWSRFAGARKPQYESAAVGQRIARAKRRTKRARSPEPGRVGFGVTPTRGGAAAGVWGSF